MRLGRDPDRVGPLVVLVAFAVSRLAVWGTGGRFSMDLLGLQPQLLDPAELRAHPFGAVADLHTQPPLFNLLVGGVLRWSPLPDALSFQILYVACGVVIALGCRAVAVHLGAGPWVATGAALVVVLNPYLLTFEHTLTYEYPVAALLVGAAWLLGRFEAGGTLPAFAGFVALATAVVLTRSLFHPVWLVGVVGLAARLGRARFDGRRLAAVVAVAAVAVAIPVVGNGLRFGSWGLSSFLGMNLQRSITAPIEEDVVRADVAAGRLSDVALVVPFSGYEAYAGAEAVDDACGREGSAVLDEVVRSTGFANFNADCYLPLYRAAQADALQALRDHPGRFVETRAAAVSLYLSNERFLGADSPVTRALATVEDPLLLTLEHRIGMGDWATPVAGLPSLPSRPSLTTAAALVVTLAAGVGAVARRRGRSSPRPGDLLRIHLGGTVAFVTLVGLTLELGENGRFRVLLDPLLLTVLVVEVGRVVARRRSVVR